MVVRVALAARVVQEHVQDVTVVVADVAVVVQVVAVTNALVV